MVGANEKAEMTGIVLFSMGVAIGYLGCKFSDLLAKAMKSADTGLRSWLQKRKAAKAEAAAKATDV